MKMYLKIVVLSACLMPLQCFAGFKDSLEAGGAPLAVSAASALGSVGFGLWSGHIKNLIKKERSLARQKKLKSTRRVLEALAALSAVAAVGTGAWGVKRSRGAAAPDSVPHAQTRLAVNLEGAVPRDQHFDREMVGKDASSPRASAAPAQSRKQADEKSLRSLDRGTSPSLAPMRTRSGDLASAVAPSALPSHSQRFLESLKPFVSSGAPATLQQTSGSSTLPASTRPALTPPALASPVLVPSAVQTSEPLLRSTVGTTPQNASRAPELMAHTPVSHHPIAAVQMRAALDVRVPLDKPTAPTSQPLSTSALKTTPAALAPASTPQVVQSPAKAASSNRTTQCLQAPTPPVSTLQEVSGIASSPKVPAASIQAVTPAPQAAATLPKQSVPVPTPPGVVPGALPENLQPLYKHGVGLMERFTSHQVVQSSLPVLPMRPGAQATPSSFLAQPPLTSSVLASTGVSVPSHKQTASSSAPASAVEQIPKPLLATTPQKAPQAQPGLRAPAAVQPSVPASPVQPGAQAAPSSFSAQPLLTSSAPTSKLSTPTVVSGAQVASPAAASASTPQAISGAASMAVQRKDAGVLASSGPTVASSRAAAAGGAGAPLASGGSTSSVMRFDLSSPDTLRVDVEGQSLFDLGSSRQNPLVADLVGKIVRNLAGMLPEGDGIYCFYHTTSGRISPARSFAFCFAPDGSLVLIEHTSGKLYAVEKKLFPTRLGYKLLGISEMPMPGSGFSEFTRVPLYDWASLFQEFFATLPYADVATELAVFSSFGDYGEEQIDGAAACWGKGVRSTMENAHKIINPGARGIGFYGVYDGHCGDEAAKKCVVDLGECIIDKMSTPRAEELLSNPATFKDSIVSWLQEYDNNLIRAITDDSGATIGMVITDRLHGFIHVVWLGDVRALVIKNNRSFVASRDHKLEDDRQRIEKANGCLQGGIVGHWGSEKGLDVPRSLGDSCYKKDPSKMIISNEPGVITVPWTGDVVGVYLACDGVWDVLSNQQVTATVLDMQAKSKTPLEIAQCMAARAFAGVPEQCEAKQIEEGVLSREEYAEEVGALPCSSKSSDNITSMFIDLRGQASALRAHDSSRMQSGPAGLALAPETSALATPAAAAGGVGAVIPNPADDFFVQKGYTSTPQVIQKMPVQFFEAAPPRSSSVTGSSLFDLGGAGDITLLADLGGKIVAYLGGKLPSRGWGFAYFKDINRNSNDPTNDFAFGFDVDGRLVFMQKKTGNFYLVCNHLVPTRNVDRIGFEIPLQDESLISYMKTTTLYDWTSFFQVFFDALPSASVSADLAYFKNFYPYGEEQRGQAAACWGKGLRSTMEDAHEIITPGSSEFGFYGIYDGHGGAGVAAECGKNFGRSLIDDMKRWELDALSSTEAFKEKAAEFMVAYDVRFSDQGVCGSTVVSVITDAKNRLLHIVWLGDARALILKKDGSFEASADHKPDSEVDRITAAGGTVGEQGRLEGRSMGMLSASLAVSRALGDFEYKTRPDALLVSNVPGVITVPWTDDIVGAYLACDGVWDVLSNEQVAATVLAMQDKNKTPLEIAQCMAARAFVGLPKELRVPGLKPWSTDNISSMFVDLRGGCGYTGAA